MQNARPVSICVNKTNKRTNKQTNNGGGKGSEVKGVEGYSFSPEGNKKKKKGLHLYFEKRPALSFPFNRAGYLWRKGTKDMTFCLDHWRIDAVLFTQSNEYEANNDLKLKAGTRKKKVFLQLYSQPATLFCCCCWFVWAFRQGEDEQITARIQKKNELAGKNFVKSFFQKIDRVGGSKARGRKLWR